MKNKLVCVVDDDESVRESLPDLLRTFGFDVEPFASAEAFLGAGGPERAGCLILDVIMPGMSGLALQVQLSTYPRHIPIVFITSSGDDTVKSRVMARGAIACLFKPFSESEVLNALNAAFRDSEAGTDA